MDNPLRNYCCQSHFYFIFKIKKLSLKFINSFSFHHSHFTDEESEAQRLENLPEVVIREIMALGL